MRFFFLAEYVVHHERLILEKKVMWKCRQNHESKYLQTSHYLRKLIHCTNENNFNSEWERKQMDWRCYKECKGENSIFRRMTKVITERNDTEPVILSVTENGWYQE
jgi:hypothetical protein